MSAFFARLVRPPCDSCPAWRRLVTRTHRLMLVSPRKQKATVSGGGGTAGALWVAVRAGPCLLPQTHTAERPGGRGHLHTPPHDMGAAYKCSHSALAPVLPAAQSPHLSRSILSCLMVQSLQVGSKAGQARVRPCAKLSFHRPQFPYLSTEADLTFY